MIKVKSNDLNNALNMVAPVALGSGKVMPILGCVKITTDSDKKRLSIVASNMEMQIETSCHAEFPYHDSNGGCIDADKLSKFTKASGNDVVLDITIGSDNKAVLKGKSRSTVNVLNVSDFPEMRVDLDKSIIVKLASSDLALAFDNVNHCVAQNDVRLFLNGISFKLVNGELTVVGSDGFRLSTITLPVNVSNDLSIDCIIPLKTAQTIAKTFKAGNIELRLNRSSLSVTDGETTIIGKNIDAKFPDFGRVLNVVRTNNLVVNRADLISGIESVLLTATDQVKRVSMKFTDNNINLVCRNSQGEQSETDILCEYDGESFEFGINADYLLASAKKIENIINVHWIDTTSFILTGSDESGPVHLLMPINL